MKTVIYKSLGTLCMTSEENFKARIQDARKVQEMRDFETPEEIIEYMVKYCRADRNDFIIDKSAA